ncbi:unnamed protein product [Anisakis simplex]|uniref:Myosin_tail_1 domain-containing protein n=1 Tax=Anisakis simplex TaxID=6269 RepID=A0A0M3J766_ANISI|nr:unnamed protein product [Anisakis simplex]
MTEATEVGVKNFSSKQKVEVELDQSKERVRRLEIDIEKLLAENKTLHENEDKARLALKDEIEKVRRLERELQDAKHEIDELKRRLNLLDQENKQRLESALQTRRSDTGNGTCSQS